MNTKNTVTSALLALGLISAGSVASYGDTPGVVIGANTYTEVFITGSTAARANIYNALFASSSGVFTGGPVGSEGAGGGTITNGTSNYTVWGQIGGQNYAVCADFTGSEAGLYALQHESSPLTDVSPYILPGTPNPTAFVNPNTGVTFTNTADLAMSDTSVKVSLSFGGSFATITDFGLVGAVTFEWMKGKNSTGNTSSDTSWKNLTNITDPQASVVLGSPDQYASYFTGVATNLSGVYVVGRNRGSGTHQNTMLDTLYGTTTAVNQYVAADATYTGNPLTLTFGSIQSISSAGGIYSVGNDGYDSGGSVAKTLEDDESGAIDPGGNGTSGLILLGYLGLSDAATAAGGGAVGLTLNGVPENDGNVENGTYSYWGHEHLYGTHSVDAAVTAVGQSLVGTSVNSTFGSGTTAGGALQTAGGLGGSNLAAQDAMIAPKYMNADKPNDGDSGYASQL